VPSLQRWRLAALRGQCYFEQRRFVKAQGDLVYAIQEEPQHENLPLDQKQERMLLHLHLAATYRELHQLQEALEQFQFTLTMMNRDTPFGYVAEAHWGLALIALAQATKMEQGQENTKEREAKLLVALHHAESAHHLYIAIGETLHAASVACNVAEIEYELGRKEKTRQGLLELVQTWDIPAETTQPSEQRRQKEQANIVSTASCLLAEIELADKHYPQALDYAKRALAAGERSYILRRADANVMLGRIFASMHNDEQAEQAFREALRELEQTDRIGVRISTHVRFGSYLLSRGKTQEGQGELEKARLLSDAVLLGNDRTSPRDAMV
jgi:tetratricopeptide (TPR) repeat protein